MNRFTSCSHLRGFTLIELLVVISIIALLIAILLPALTQAREVARAVECLSRNRQLHIAAMNFTNDFDQMLPLNIHSNSGTFGGQFGNWDTVFVSSGRLTLADYMGMRSSTRINFPGTTWNGSTLSGQQLNTLQKRIMWCTDLDGSNEEIEHFPSLGINQRITTRNGWTPTNPGGARYSIDQLDRLSEIFLFGDIEWGPTDGGTNNEYLYGALDPETTSNISWWKAPRHNGYSNFVFLDGHGEKIAFQDFTGVGEYGNNYWFTYPWQER